MQQSRNWVARKHVRWFVNDGFPFDEGWPTCTPTDEFKVILRDGEVCKARVDFSTQYRAEGKKWRTHDGRTFGKQVVIAWCEHVSES